MAEIIAVFDTNVFLQCLLNSNGPAAACVNHVFVGRVGLSISEETLAELDDLVERPNIQALSTALTFEKVQSFTDKLLETAKLIERTPVHFEFPRDLKDEKFINLAISCGADFLVTRDRDLLDLMTDFSFEAKEFRQKFRKLKIVTPDQFLKILQTD